MRIVMFYHSIISDWNHGNAHFLRGVVAELLARGHTARVFEPRDAWSIENLVSEYGPLAIERFRSAFPYLTSERYDRCALDLDDSLDGCELVIVHEWNEPELVR